MRKLKVKMSSDAKDKAEITNRALEKKMERMNKLEEKYHKWVCQSLCIQGEVVVGLNMITTQYN